MNSKIIKMTILATASSFAIASFAIADEKDGDESKGPQRGERGGRPGGPGGPSGGDREAFVKEFDENKDGELDDGERKKARAEMQKRFEKRGEERFKQQDSNKDGVLSLEEFKAGNNRLGDRADEIYSRLNTDGKDGLTKEELAKGRQARGPRGERTGGPRGEGAREGEGAEGEGKRKGKRRPPVDES